MVKKIIKGFLVSIIILFLFIGLKIHFIGKILDKEKINTYVLKSQNKHNISLTFLGTAGFIINYNKTQLVCDPFFSNPSLSEMFFAKPSKPSLKTYISDSLYNNISLITISHGHYDHCLDIENFTKQKSTKIVSDESNLLMLNSVVKNNITIPIKYNETPTWIYDKDSTFRVLPIATIHAPHIANITFLDGCYTSASNHFPSKVWDWEMGKCNFFIIDVLQKEDIIYRMAIVGGKMMPEAEKLFYKTCAEQKCDLLAPIFWKKSINYNDVLRLQKKIHPDILLLQHWNNFFGSNAKPLEYFRSSKITNALDDFKKQGINATIMLPFTTVQL